MNALLQEYLPLGIFLYLSAAIGLALLVAPFIVAYRQPDAEKLSAYECAFNTFDDAWWRSSSSSSTSKSRSCFLGRLHSASLAVSASGR
jgi:NADH:ubiquinone oxidoreductase subunit 3 (subunit A)